MSLGIVLTPYGKNPGGYPPAAIDYTYKGATEWLGSRAANEANFDKPGTFDPRLDPQFNTRGEGGYYSDTPLGRALGSTTIRLSPLNIMLASAAVGLTTGLVSRKLRGSTKKQAIKHGALGAAIAAAAGGIASYAISKYGVPVGGINGVPTDFQLATRYGYLPFVSGWIRTKQGWQTGPWLPPDGNPAWSGYPTPIAPIDGYARSTTPAPNGGLMPGLGEASAQDVMAAMMAHNDRLFALTLVSTTAVAVSALLGVFRTLRLIATSSND